MAEAQQVVINTLHGIVDDAADGDPRQHAAAIFADLSAAGYTVIPTPTTAYFIALDGDGEIAVWDGLSYTTPVPVLHAYQVPAEVWPVLTGHLPVAAECGCRLTPTGPSSAACTWRTDATTVAELELHLLHAVGAA